MSSSSIIMLWAPWAIEGPVVCRVAIGTDGNPIVQPNGRTEVIYPLQLREGKDTFGFVSLGLGMEMIPIMQVKLEAYSCLEDGHPLVSAYEKAVIRGRKQAANLS